MWINLFNEDFALRILGFITGLSIISIIWLNSRLFKHRVPLLSLALFIFNPLSINLTDSIRPYGIGILLLLILFGLIWIIIEQGRLWQIAAGIFVAILSVQCLYQNAFFIGSIILAGIAVTLYQRQWKKTLTLIVIGAAAAASLLPYLQTIRNTQYWVVIMQSPHDYFMVLKTFISALNIDDGLFYLMWMGLIFISHIFVLSGIKSRQKNTNSLLIYSLSAMILCVLAQLYFVQKMQVPVWPRYFLPVIAIMSIFVDIVFGCFEKLCAIRITLALLITITSFNACKRKVEMRQTNVDLTAASLEKLADKDDLIIVNPWYLATGFQKYYHGKAPFTTLPPIDEYKFHRFDLIREKMILPNPVEPVISKAKECLDSQHTVWVVGWRITPFVNLPPLALEPAPNTEYGWNGFAYTNNWEEQVLYFIETSSKQKTVLRPTTKTLINPLENCTIMKVEGLK